MIATLVPPVLVGSIQVTFKLPAVESTLVVGATGAIGIVEARILSAGDASLVPCTFFAYQVNEYACPDVIPVLTLKVLTRESDESPTTAVPSIRRM